MLESMRHQYTSILLNVIFFASIIASDSCSPNPIAIRIGNITLANHQVARGAEIDIGDPPQSFAFLPQWYVQSLTDILIASQALNNRTIGLITHLLCMELTDIASSSATHLQMMAVLL